MNIIAAIDYSVFPPINATLNGISTVLLVVGFLFIKSGKKEAHKKAMIGALVSSSVFLCCYLTYHYGAGHTTFPKEYPTCPQDLPRDSAPPHRSRSGQCTPDYHARHRGNTRKV
jgi:hypothetical protein